MKRRVTAVVLALVLAVVGFGLVFSYVHGADARAVESQHPVTAFIVRKLVPAGTSLEQARTQGLIAATKVTESGRPTGALTAVDATNSSLIATTDIQPGEFVMTARFGSKPVGEQAIGVPNGMIAISVQLTAPERVANFITPGSHIAIYATHGIKSLGTSDADKNFNGLNFTGTNVLLPDAEVIAFGSTPLQNPSGNSTSSGKSNSTTNSSTNDSAYLVTVAVSPADSTRLVHAVNGYTLYAGLLGSGTKINPQGETDDGNTFGGRSLMHGSVGAGS
jgi:pilus assembly protein CpaB